MTKLAGMPGDALDLGASIIGTGTFHASIESD